METVKAIREASTWLAQELSSQTFVAAAEIKRRGTEQGFSTRTIYRAANVLGVVSRNIGFPRRTHWMLKQGTVMPESANHI